MLKLLLDEHISPSLAEGLNRRHRTLTVHFMAEWENGKFLGQDDSACLERAPEEHVTLVTDDRRTLPPLLKAWVEAGRNHGGVIFIDDKTLAGGYWRSGARSFKSGARSWGVELDQPHFLPTALISGPSPRALPVL